MPNRKIRVLLIEDNRFLREGITQLLKTHGGFTIYSPREDDPSLQMEDLDSPTIILLDLGLEGDSIKLMKSLRERFPEARFVAMDILPEQEDMVEFVRAGGSGFILKNAPVDDYVKTILAVAGGATVLPPPLTQSLFSQIVESVLKYGKTVPNHAVQLTRREREVVELISAGMSNKEIAQELHIATFTVKSHVHNVLEKLELSTRLQIAAYVRDEPN